MYTVRYWNGDERINDCWGNSVSWCGKARTLKEALRKAKKINGNSPFRIYSISA